MTPSLEITTYEEALELYTYRLNTHRLKCGVRLSNNTYMISPDEPRGTKPLWFAVRLHDTNIVTFHRDGRIVLDSGTWLTVTTKNRMNLHTPMEWTLYSDRGIWYLWSHEDQDFHKTIPYADGITLLPDGSITGEGEDPRKQIKLRNRAKRYAQDYVEALYAGNIPAPGNGDCWGCLFKTTDGSTPLGGADHIISHFDDDYFVPSLVVRAIERFPVSQAGKHDLSVLWNPEDARNIRLMGMQDQIRKSVQRWCYAELGLGV
jgi:hypothetical protein